MSPAAELVRTALLALLAGVALPVLVQLYFTLRVLARSTTAMERKLDATLSAIDRGVAGAGRTPGGEALSLLAAAVAPAILAGVRAYRASGEVEARDLNGKEHAGRAAGWRASDDERR